MGLRELSTVLWEERQLLDLLLFKLEEESLVLASGRHTWLARASSEVEFVLERIKDMEKSREEEVAELVADYAIGAKPTLSALADVVPEPWSGTLREHQYAFRIMMDKIQQVANRNREVLAQYVVAVSDALAIAGAHQGPRYDRSGSAPANVGSGVLDASA